MDNHRANPYSLEIHGDLGEYLWNCSETCVDNLFSGPKYFFAIRDSGLMIPLRTFVRVGLSPIPDLLYFVNQNFWLESNGGGEHNMSAILAKRGVYDLRKVLSGQLWSIHDLNFSEIMQRKEAKIRERFLRARKKK
jgi:hypothetical protein